MSDPNLWALDVRPYPFPTSPEHPVLAHLIVAMRREQHRGEVRVAACGNEYTDGTHPRGWWSTRSGNLPLQGHAIHCGADIISEQRALTLVEHTIEPGRLQAIVNQADFGVP
jgi:hypothetical protein